MRGCAATYHASWGHGELKVLLSNGTIFSVALGMLTTGMVFCAGLQLRLEYRNIAFDESMCFVNQGARNRGYVEQ